MRVVYVSTDEGVPTFGTKGSSVHVQAMLSPVPRPRRRGAPRDLPSRARPHRRTCRGSGCTCCRDPEARNRRRRDAAPRREAAARARDAQVALTLGRLHDDGRRWTSSTSGTRCGGAPPPPGRGRTGCAASSRSTRRCPTSRPAHRVLVDRPAAVDVAYAATGQADLVVCVSEPVADWVRASGPPARTRSTPSRTASTPGASARPRGAATCRRSRSGSWGRSSPGTASRTWCAPSRSCTRRTRRTGCSSSATAPSAAGSSS